jgi:hypothetical protein
VKLTLANRCKALAVAAVVLLLGPRAAGAQVLTIGETLGKGKSGLLLTDNVVVPGDGIPNLNIAYLEFAKGLTDRFDLYLSAGRVGTDGEAQGFIGGGGNFRLARIRKLTLSLFSVASVALNRRDEACQVLLNPALVASVPLGPKLTLYSGLNGLIPIGDRARGIFTPPSAKVNVPIGGTYAIRSWGLWAEADFGTIQAAGFGLTRIF